MNALIRFSEAMYGWLDERLGLTMVLRATVLHRVPRSVNWWYVFGSAVLTAFMIQVITGIFLTFSYIPSPDHAYDSLDYITHRELLGNILRGIHYWGASAMVLLIFIHMTAHFLTGSYKYPRELHWLTGSVLLILTIGMAFTGQLIRWNQDSYWAIVVGAEQAARTPFIGQWVAQLLLAGPHVTGDTLTRVYGIHIWLLPGALFTFIGIHLYLVIYKGISEWPVPGKPVDPKTYWADYQEILHTDGEPFFPVGVSKDAIMSLIVILMIVGLAVFVGAAELGPRANPTQPANPKPDWYLIWYFALLALVGVEPSGAAVTPWLIIFFPAVAFGILFLIPLANKGERHYSRRPWALAVVGIAAVSTAALMYIGYTEPWKPVLYIASNGNVIIPQVPRSTYASLPPDAQHGAKLFNNYACITCHVIENVGGERGPNLTYVGERLSRDQLIWRINRGGGGMPSYGDVARPKDIYDLVAYLQARVHAGAQQAASGGQ